MSREIQIKFKLTGDSAEGRAFVDNLMKLGTVSDDASKRITELEQKLATLQSQLSNSKSKFTDFNGALAQFSSSLREHVTTPIGTLSFSVGQLSNLIGVQNTVMLGAAATMARASIATFEFVKGQAEAAQTTTNLALRLGITADQAYNLQAMAKISGVQITGLQQAARVLSVALEDSTGSGKKASAILRDMGVASHDAAGNIRDEGQVLMEVLEHLSKIPDTAKRVYEAQQLLGRGAKEIQPIILNYQALQETLKEMHIQFGAAGTELDKTAESINAMDVAWENFKKNLAAKIAPVVITATGTIGDMLSGKFNPSSSLVKFLFPLLTRENPNTPEEPLTRQTPTDIIESNRLGAGFRKNYQGGTLEGMQSRLAEVNKDIQENVNTLSGTGIGTAARSGFEQTLKNLENEKAALKENIKAWQDRQTLLGQLPEKASLRFHEQMGGEFGKIQAEEEKQFRTLGVLSQAGIVQSGPGTIGFTPSILKPGALNQPGVQDVITEFGSQRLEYIKKLIEEQKKKLNIGDERTRPLGNTDYQNVFKLKPAESNEPAEREFKLNLERDIKAGEELKRKLDEITKIDENTQRADVASQARQQTRAIEFAGGQRGGGSAVGQAGAAYQVQVNLANQLFAIDDKRNKSDLDNAKAAINAVKDVAGEKETTRKLDEAAAAAEINHLNLVAELNKSINASREQFENKILELREKQIEAERAGAGQVFDAIFNRRPGEAFANLTKTFFTGQLKTIFENVVTQPGGIAGKVSDSFGQIGAQSGLGKILKGTAFDPAKGGIKTAADELLAGNTSASVLNTTAINTLTSTLTGQPTGGASPVGIIPGAGLAGMIPGAGLAGMTPGAGLAGMTPPNLGPFNPGSIPGVGTFGSDVNGPLGITLPPFTGAGASNPFFTSAAQAAGLPASNPFFGDLSGLPAGEAGGNDNGVATFGVTGTDTGATDLSSLGFGKLPAPLPFNTTPGPSILQQIGMGTSSLASFGKGGGGGLFAGVMQGGYSGTNDNLSTPTERVANVVASAGAVVTGAAGVIKGIEQGGARGTLGAAGSALGVASLIPGPQQPFIAGAAMLAGLIKNFLPDPRQQFARQQAATLAGIKYDQPQGISLNENTQGYLSSTNFRGQVENLGFKPQVSTYQQATGFLPNYPGPLGNLTGSTNYDFLQTQTQRQISYNNSGSQSPTIQVTIPVQTFDSKSFMDNSTSIGNALVQAIQQGHRVMNDIANKVRAF